MSIEIKNVYSICNTITSSLVFYNESGKHTVFHDLQETLPILMKQAELGSELTKKFVELVWRVEKYCHSLKEYPVESVFRPNFDIYRSVGLGIASFIFQGDLKKIETFICQAMESSIMWERFGHLMLASLLRSTGRLEEAYSHARAANNAFSQCGASYRTYYECWNACRKAGISVQESFPIQMNIQKKFCSLPFEFLSIRNDGEKIILAPCQTSLWMSYAKTYPSAFLNSEKEIPDFWNSMEFQEIRRSILDGDFTYCSKVRCPKLLQLPDADSIKDSRLRNIIDNKKIFLHQGPKVLVLGYDETCNLTCPSCRKHPIIPSPSLRQAFDIMADRFIIPIISSEIDYILLNCSGEALASPHTLRLMNNLPFKKYPNLKIHLMSNGELLADRWDHLGLAGDHISVLILSFDGITEKTYTQFRRGGNFKRFISGMKFASKLKQQNKISHICAVMTIFAGNMHEAIQIYEFCNDYGFDSMMINKFQNWGTFSTEEFVHMDVWNTNHHQHKEWNTIFNTLKELSKNKKTVLNTTNIM